MGSISTGGLTANYSMYTAPTLEELLSTKKYKAVARLDYSKVPNHYMDGVRKMDNVRTFGVEITELFDKLFTEYGRLPTQREYIAAGMPICKAYWEDNRYSESINGYPFTKGVEMGITDRLARTYSSKVVEMHLELMLQDMGYKVLSHPVIDMVMGVDMIVQDEYARYYLHVTTSVRGHDAAEKNVMQKEKRGHLEVEGEKYRYYRNFKQDCIIVFETGRKLPYQSTKWVNGHPLFYREYVDHYMAAKRLGNKKELLTGNINRLDDFVQWVQSHGGQDIYAEMGV